MEKGQQEDQLFNNAEVLGIQEKSMDNKKKSHELAAKMFDDALDSMTKGGNKDNSIEKLVENFEEYSQNEDGIEFWYARDLQKLFDYDEWRNFQRVIEKAKQACSTSGNEISHHFVDVNKVIEVGKGAQMEVSDIQMTRYACYLAAQNGDSRKKTVAFAQTYFAIQTRKQEIRDEDEASIPPISEDKKRLLLRNEIKEHNKRLASAAKSAGVEKPIDYAVFQNFGYKGLYGGLDRVGIQRKKGLKSRANILDHMGSTELAANLFRATQAEEKLKREGIKGKDKANNAHHEVGLKVREAIKEIGGTMPEELPPAEDIIKVGRRMQKAIASGNKKESKKEIPGK